MVLEGRPSGRVGRRRISTSSPRRAHDAAAGALPRSRPDRDDRRYARRRHEERPMADKRGSRGRPQPARRKQPAKKRARGEGGFGPYHKADSEERDDRRRRPDEPSPRRDANQRPTLRVVGKRAQPSGEPRPTRKRTAAAPAKPRRRRR